MRNFWRFSAWILEILFQQVYSFLLAGRFSFHNHLIFSPLVYRLPCYLRLSIFNRVTNLFHLILYIFWCSFRYMLANSIFAFLSFRALTLVRFLLLHLEEVFTPACFLLTTNVSHGTLGLALCLVGIHSAAASIWPLTKFSLLSF